MTSCIRYRMETVDTTCSGGRAKILGSVVCIGGVMTMILYRGRTLFNLHEQPSLASETNTRKGIESWVISSMSLLLGTVAWSSWFLIQNNIGKTYPRKYSSTAIISSFAAVQSAAVAFLLSGSETKLSVWILKGKIEIFTVLFTVNHPGPNTCTSFALEGSDFPSHFLTRPTTSNAGGGRFGAMLCGDVVVRQEKGPSLHVSIQSCDSDHGGHDRYPFPS